MVNKIKYIKRAKIEEVKFRQRIKRFALDADAQSIASFARLNRNTIERYLIMIRGQIAWYGKAQSPFKEEVEVDEAYFGGKHVKGQIGRNE